MNKHYLNKLTHHLRITFTLLTLITPFFSGVSFAQLNVAPVNSFRSTPTPAQKNGSARIQALQLPFFDDFAGNDVQPDPLYWQPRSNVYINNTMTTRQPSMNVATFDGLKSNGQPYNTDSYMAWGGTDTLTSLPIDLQGLTASDNVYLSYYLLPKGFGELPDSMDLFYVEFLNQLGKWELATDSVQTGGWITDMFQQKFIKISNPGFFHAGFQFRFRAMGRQSGGFDTWNLDYVYLNKGRSATDQYVVDITCQTPLSPLLSRYTAMPLKQYRLGTAKETTASVDTPIKSLGDPASAFNTVTSRFVVRNDATGAILQDLTQNPFIRGQETQLINNVVSPFPVTNTDKRLRLKYTFSVDQNYDVPPPIPVDQLRRNDTISSYTDLDDYYAYDDGSAEYMLWMNRLGRVAVRYVMNQKDTLAGVKMALVPVFAGVSGQAFTIQVWSNKNGKPDGVLYQQSATVNYANTRNGFTDFKFASGVAVPDTFYIGWLQIAADRIAFGFDKNSQLGNEHLFYNISSQEWVQETGLKGSLMIRPYVGGVDNNPITGEEPTPVLKVQVYPNPTDGIIRWDNERITKIEVFTIAGNQVHSINPRNGEKETSLSSLQNGLYILRLTDGKVVTTQKILLYK